jgi:hypothetical protein
MVGLREDHNTLRNPIHGILETVDTFQTLESSGTPCHTHTITINENVSEPMLGGITTGTMERMLVTEIMPERLGCYLSLGLEKT